MVDDASFGRWVEHRRRSLLLTREQLGQCVACSAATIRKIEADERRPSKDVAERLSECLKVDQAERSAFLRFARGEASYQRPSPVPTSSSIWQPEPRWVTTNLPAATTRLIGREYERQAITELLESPHVRLVTLTGVGGTGKTRLALQVAADMLDTFRDGVWFVNLAPISDPQLVIPTISVTLGVSEVSGQPLLATLTKYLKDKHLLLVLDNFEQVVPAVVDIAELLAAAPGLKVLATSRTPLHLYAEHEYPVPALQLPDLKHLPPLERLTQYEAVQFFMQRVQAVKPDFQITNANAPAVAEICVRLDGLPLAIELAATRIKLLTPQAMVRRLNQRLTLLTGGARDLPARQQTLRAAIDWSYHLLTAGEQTLFRRLAVFVGGRTLEAIEAICNAEGDLAVDILDGIAALLDNNLLRQEEGPQSTARFLMLETIHEYARGQLDASGEVAPLQQRHAVYFQTIAEQAEAELNGPEQARWLQLLEVEHDNFRAALQWFHAQHHVEAGLVVANGLRRFWLMHGFVSEGREWFARFLQDQAISTVALATRAKALNEAGTLAAYQCDYAQGRQFFEKSVALRRQLDDRKGVAASLSNLAIVAHALGDDAAARLLNEESLALRRELGDSWGVANSLSNVGVALIYQGEYDAAQTLLTESFDIHQTLGDKQAVAITLNNLGNVAIYRGDYVAARQYHDESLRLRRELGDKQGITDCLEGLAAIATDLQQAERAARLFAAAAALRALFGTPLLPAEKVVHERLATACAQMDAHTWERAWNEGQTMSLEQVVEYALEAGG